MYKILNYKLLTYIMNQLKLDDNILSKKNIKAIYNCFCRCRIRWPCGMTPCSRCARKPTNLGNVFWSTSNRNRVSSPIGPFSTSAIASFQTSQRQTFARSVFFRFQVDQKKRRTSLQKTSLTLTNENIIPLVLISGRTVSSQPYRN